MEVEMFNARGETSNVKFSSKKQPETFVSLFSMIPRRQFTGDSPTSALCSPPLQPVSSVTTSNDKHSNFSRCPIPRPRTSSYSSSKSLKYHKNDLRDRDNIGIAEIERTETINDVVGLQSSEQMTSTLLDEQPRSQKTSFVHSEYHSRIEPNEDDCLEERESVKSIISRLESISKPVDCQPKSTLTKRGMWLNQTANKNKKVSNVTSLQRNEYHKTDVSSTKVNNDKVKPTLTKFKPNSIDDVTTDNVVKDKVKPSIYKKNSNDVFRDYSSHSRRSNDHIVQSEKLRLHLSKHGLFEPSANYRSNSGIERTDFTEILKYNKRCDTNNNSSNSGDIKHNESITKVQTAFVSHDVPPSSPEYVTAKRNETLTPMVQKTFISRVALPSSAGYMTVKRNKHPTPIDTEKSFNENTTKSLKAFVSRVTLPSSSEFKTVKGIENPLLIDTENSIRQPEFSSTREVRDQSENQIQNDRRFTTDIAKDSNQKLIGSLSTLLDNQYLSQSFAAFRSRRKHWFQNNKYSGHHDNNNFLEGDYSNDTDKEDNNMDLYLGNPSLNKAFHVFRVRRRNSDINSTNKCNMLN